MRPHEDAWAVILLAWVWWHSLPDVQDAAGHTDKRGHRMDQRRTTPLAYGVGPQLEALPDVFGTLLSGTPVPGYNSPCHASERMVQV